MITISDKGAEKVHEFLATQDADVSMAGLRVGVRGGGCSGFQYQLAFDEQRAGDVVFESHGLKLLVDNESLPFVQRLDDRLRGEPPGRGLQGQQPQRRGGMRLRLLVPRSRAGAGLSGLTAGWRRGAASPVACGPSSGEACRGRSSYASAS